MTKFLKHVIIFNAVFLLWTQNAQTQDTLPVKGLKKDTIYLQNINTPSETILKYREVLENESKEHREYLEKLYLIATTIFGAVGTLFLALLYFFWGKSKKEIRSQVDENFKLKVDEIIKEQTNQIEKLYKRKYNFFTNWMNRVILELSETVVNQMDDKPLASVNYEKLKGKNVLWVDDKPENNEQHIEVFKNVGVDFVLVKTTDEAKKELKKNNFDLIISNMGRPPKENEPDNPEEGIEFLKFLKLNQNKTPTIIYTKPENQKKYGDKALAEGAYAVTQGYTGLFKQVLKHLAI